MDQLAVKFAGLDNTQTQDRRRWLSAPLRHVGRLIKWDFPRLFHQRSFTVAFARNGLLRPSVLKPVGICDAKRAILAGIWWWARHEYGVLIGRGEVRFNWRNNPGQVLRAYTAIPSNAQTKLAGRIDVVRFSGVDSVRGVWKVKGQVWVIEAGLCWWFY